MSVAIDKIS